MDPPDRIGNLFSDKNRFFYLCHLNAIRHCQFRLYLARYHSTFLDALASLESTLLIKSVSQPVIVSAKTVNLLKPSDYDDDYDDT